MNVLTSRQKEMLGHSNCDVLKLQREADGMKITSKTCRPEEDCEVCIQGKFSQTRTRKPDARAKAPQQLVHADLAGPKRVVNGYQHAQSVIEEKKRQRRSQSDTI